MPLSVPRTEKFLGILYSRSLSFLRLTVVTTPKAWNMVPPQAFARAVPLSGTLFPQLSAWRPPSLHSSVSRPRPPSTPPPTALSSLSICSATFFFLNLTLHYNHPLECKPHNSVDLCLPCSPLYSQGIEQYLTYSRCPKLFTE